MIIDFHCHAGEGDGLTGPWDTRAPLDVHLRRARDAGIARTVIFPAFHSDLASANQAIAALVARAPDQLIGFAFVDCVRNRGHIDRLVETAVRRHRLRGLKVHRAQGRITREVCEAARRFALPIVYDPMGELSTVELVAEEYPDVSFIIPHLSSFADDWKAQIGFIDQLARLPNLYGDTSGVRRFDVLERAVRRAGPHKVLFGSDGPWLHPGVELYKVQALGLPPEDERLVLGGNALRMLGAGEAGQGRLG